jgi:hypothetical protein
MLTQCPRCQALTNPTWHRCPVCRQVLNGVLETVNRPSTDGRMTDQEQPLEQPVVPCLPPTRGEGMKLFPLTWHCPCCKGTRRWRSIYGVLICGTCHPPGDLALVAGWEASKE